MLESIFVPSNLQHSINSLEKAKGVMKNEETNHAEKVDEEQASNGRIRGGRSCRGLKREIPNPIAIN